LDYRELVAWNGLKDPNKIYAGQVLRMQPPLRKKAASRAVAKPPPTAQRSQRATQARAPGAAADSSNTKPAARVSRYPPSTAAGAALRWAWPTDGRLSQTFADKDRSRQGIKIKGILGQPIRAAEAGKIVYSGSGLIGYGKLIIIKHNKNYLSAYGHNRKILVKEGDQVARGEPIGEMGRPPDGDPVLHFEIRRGGTPVDPIGLLPHRG
jgi:lipoprotein NlpD